MRFAGSTKTTLLTILCLMLFGGIAHAHGGMAGPDEMGPPVGMSVAIGIACYYVITLWPRRRELDRRTGKNGRRTR